MSPLRVCELEGGGRGHTPNKRDYSGYLRERGNKKPGGPHGQGQKGKTWKKKIHKNKKQNTLPGTKGDYPRRLGAPMQLIGQKDDLARHKKKAKR